jgi:hypothetical protein
MVESICGQGFSYAHDVKEKTKILVKLELHATKETANNGGGG